VVDAAVACSLLTSSHSGPERAQRLRCLRLRCFPFTHPVHRASTEGWSGSFRRREASPAHTCGMSLSSHAVARRPFFLSLVRPLMLLCVSRVPELFRCASVDASPRPTVASAAMPAARGAPPMRAKLWWKQQRAVRKESNSTAYTTPVLRR
jgi:hypothetical protein